MLTEQLDILDLITDYLTGAISASDAAELRAWVEASPENERRFAAYRELWLASHHEHFDAEAALRRFRRNAALIDKRRKAASQVHRRRRLANTMRWAAVIVLPMLLIGTALLYMHVNNMLDRDICYATIAGQQSTFQLPDGTVVRMEENSELSFSATDFVYNHRSVKFHGEARFEVQADSLHPFDIITPQEQVRVVGTEFSLSSREDANYNTLILDKGHVKYTDLRANKTLDMYAGDVLTNNKGCQRIYCRHRSMHEMQQVAQEANGGTTEVQRIVDGNGRSSLIFTTNHTVAPGTYKLSMDGEGAGMKFEKAGGGYPFEAGQGTEDDPYTIMSPQQMCNMKAALVPNKMVYFALESDVDLKGIAWEPLNDMRDRVRYWINFDGRGHVIRNMTPLVSNGYSSFFGVLCGECRNVGFVNATVLASESGSGVLGGYVGHNMYPGITIVENCFFTGRVDSKNFAGGIAGTTSGRVIIRGCHSSVHVSSMTSMAGGLVARVHGQLYMENCYTDGIVSGVQAGGIYFERQAGTTPAYLTNVVAANQSVYGNRQAYAIGCATNNDNLKDVAYARSMHINGEDVKGGESHAQLMARYESWPKTWYLGHKELQ